MLKTALTLAALFGVGGHPQVQGLASTTPAFDGGSITGSVTADGRPAAGIWVTARQVGGQHPITRSAATGDDGHFQVNNLPYGAYLVFASKSGYVSSTTTTSPVYYRPGDSATISLVKGGAITGKVTDSDGAPVVAIRVAATAAPQNRQLGQNRGTTSASGVTDDRGIYRIYGLSAGKYLVSAGSSSDWPATDIAYRGLTSTYYPSATVDTATAVDVRSGGETTAIDIRFRGEGGHAISGKAVDSFGTESGPNRFVTVAVYRKDSATFVERAGAQAPAYSFAIYGIPDGVYELIATSFSNGGRMGVSQPLRVTVKGSDVTGVSIQIQTFGSISGKAVLHPLEKPKTYGCAESGPGVLPETLLLATNESNRPPDLTGPYQTTRFTGATDEKGDFEISQVTPGQYRLGVNLPDKEWYLQSIESAQSAAPSSNNASSPETRRRRVTHLDVRLGSKEGGLVVTIAQGAAEISGKIKVKVAGQPIPDGMQVYLIPAEPESVKDAFRYVEGSVNSDGAFSVGNIPPGKYRILAKVAPRDALNEVRYLTWKETSRRDLQQEGSRDGQDVELKPCQKLPGYSLPVAPESASASSRPSPSGASKL